MNQTLVVAFTILFAAIAGKAAYPQENPATKPTSRDDDWWPKRHEEKLEAAANSKDYGLVFVGDSITHSWENGGKPIWDEYYGDRKALNLGFSGDRTEHVLWRLANGALDGLNPQLIVVLIGTNNVGHRDDPPGVTAAGVTAIVDDLEKRCANAQILLLGIFPRSSGAEDKHRKLVRDANALIAKLGQRSRVRYLNLDDKFLDEDGNLLMNLMPDELHPNEAGYRIWAEAMEPVLEEMMKRSLP